MLLQSQTIHPARLMLGAVTVLSCLFGVLFPGMEAHAAEVETAEQLYHALEEEEDILLMDDIELDETLYLSEGIVLDGQGYALSYDGEDGACLEIGSSSEELPCELTDLTITGSPDADGVLVMDDGAVLLSDVAISGFADGLLVYGAATLEQCTISDNETGLSIHEEAALVTLLDGEICDNASDGVAIEDGTFRQLGGTIYANGRYGILQNGRYEIAEAAAVEEDNAVFLCAGHLVHLIDRLSQDEDIACIDLASDDRQLARQIVKAAQSVPDDYVSSLADAFIPVFDELSSDGEREGPTPVDPAIRPGNAVNAPAGTMILSGKLTARYEDGLSEEEREQAGLVIEALPEPETFYWKEDHRFTGLSSQPVPTKLLHNADGSEGPYDISGSLVCFGWHSGLALYDEPLQDETVIPAERLADAITFSAVWDIRFDLLCFGNGHTNDVPASYLLTDCVPGLPLPDNIEANFQKSIERERYDQNQEKTLPYTERYSLAGWAKRPDCSSTDPDVYHPSEHLCEEAAEYEKALGWFLAELATVTEAHDRTAEAKTIAIRLYAVWDCFPELDALNRYFTKKEKQEERLTEEELLRKAKAIDPEDGELSLSLVDFDPAELDALGDCGSVLVRYAATDSASNTSYYDAAVWITDDLGCTSLLAPERPSPVYTRFVSKEYVKQGNVRLTPEEAQTAFRNGALEPCSIWYRDDGYRSLLDDAFSRLAAKQYAASYVLSHAKLQEAQTYLWTSDLIGDGDRYRRDFYNQFLR